MKLGFIGLGRMGKAIVWHLLEQSIDVVVYNRTREKAEEFLNEFQAESKGHDEYGELILASDYRHFISLLDAPRIIWIMVEQGKPVDEVIDGGNSFYKDSIKRYQRLKEKGIDFLDIGTSGGLEGARNGACLMVGGDKEIYEKVKPMLEKIAGISDQAAPAKTSVSQAGSVSYFGPAGSGHFVKMVHNGVEYGMLEAIGEGFELLSKKANKVDLYEVAKNWKNGSVVRGWLIELLERAFSKDPELKEFSGTVGGGSTGEWTIETAKELMVEVPVIKNSVDARKRSKIKPTFSGKVIAALRKEFGGHEDNK